MRNTCKIKFKPYSVQYIQKHLLATLHFTVYPPPYNNTTSTPNNRNPVNTEDVTVWVGIIAFFGGAALLVAVVFTLNFYLLAIGGVLFIIGIMIFTWPSGSRRPGARSSYGGGGGGHDYGPWMYGWGSHQAKKNMYRGHRYTRKK
jgi:hypothetical protein